MLCAHTSETLTKRHDLWIGLDESTLVGLSACGGGGYIGCALTMRSSVKSEILYEHKALFRSCALCMVRKL